ncbi:MULTISPECIES: MauE/DoxX family redox-associated membrane protein [Cupriavidus]|uniref:MauE/DoxX family redox-associated membrane protein n=1 Tax=Cupriavidus TaxID=106589 RepID=UPI00112917F7|nr:MauE/DoxX family redox-associated membrane protein [Cupriavidus pinatubonensis]TPQ37990.1 methylamine utilization protein MauE [Cupriavidus pinatubonensis]
MTFDLVIDPVVVRTCQAGAAIVFGAAAMSKLLDMRRFEGSLDGYALLPPALVRPAAVGLALAELAVAMALPLDATRVPAALAGLLLLALFSGAIAINLWRGNRNIDCGCHAFGRRGTERQGGLSSWHLARVALLAALVAPALFEFAARDVLWVDYFTVLGGLACASGLFFVIDALLANRAVAQALES